MATNAAIAYINLADDATLTASTQLSDTAPVTFLQNPHVGRKWRSTANSANFVADMGSLVYIDTVAVMGITGATARVRLSSADATGAAGDVYDSGVMSVDQTYKQTIVLITTLGSPGTSRYLRVDITNPSGTYVEAGRLFAGDRTHFEVNAAFGWQRRWNDPSIRQRMQSGGIQVFREEPYVTIEVVFEWITEAERVGLVEAVDLLNGLHTDVLFVLDPDSSNLARDSVWGLVDDLTPVAHRTFDTYQKQYQISQRL